NWLLKFLQQSDHYHLAKHVRVNRPDQFHGDIEQLRPWLIRAHRVIAVPFRNMRRNLLVALRIRTRDGGASSELQPEVGHRAG
ncbi:MAG: hypothetical protein ACR2NP_07505, partial [Pirellulaceae bacterium]